MSSVATIGLGWEIITRKTFTTLIFCRHNLNLNGYFDPTILTQTEFGLWDFVGEAFIKMNQFQKDYLNFNASTYDSKSEVAPRPQIINYPKGGGFFDWHIHPRFPNNYGLILNLSKKGRDFHSGQTEFVDPSDDTTIIQIDDYADIGDLTIFRFDLNHRVAPVDENEDLSFSDNGRWTAVLPLR